MELILAYLGCAPKPGFRLGAQIQYNQGLSLVNSSASAASFEATQIPAQGNFDNREISEIHEKESGFAYFAYFAVSSVFYPRQD
jgi:hypothetical protein